MLVEIFSGADRGFDCRERGLCFQPRLLRLDQPLVDIEHALHHRMDDRALGVDAQIAEFAPGREDFDLGFGQPLLDLHLFLREDVEQLAGGAAVGFVHEFQVGLEDRVDHGHRRPRGFRSVGDFDDVRQTDRGGG